MTQEAEIRVVDDDESIGCLPSHAHGGLTHCECRSRPGRTVFSMYLPLALFDGEAG